MKELLVLTFVLLFSSCSKDSAASKEFHACIENGKSYYKDIGSYPTLSDGRNADTVSIEKCTNNSAAFNGN